jgi:hypothetical protein
MDSVRVRAGAPGLHYSASVVDQDDIPVVGAEVEAMGETNKPKTDSAGRFSLTHLSPGTLILRIRRVGYVAYFSSLSVLRDRHDTLRMPRLSSALSNADAREKSGFEMDHGAYRDLAQRTAWKGAMSGAVSREELEAQGTRDLCEALPNTVSGARIGVTEGSSCTSTPKHVLIDGWRCQSHKLTDFHADQVELLEYFPRGSDLAGTFESRRCALPVYVVWMRSDAKLMP